jgi:hypothetical protein
MQAYVELVKQVSPGWSVHADMAEAGCVDDDLSATYFFLSHEAIDALYAYGRQLAVPMQAISVPERHAGTNLPTVLPISPLC